MKSTYRNLVGFINAAAHYTQVHPEETKLKYALSKVQKRAMSAVERYNEQLEDLRVQHCAEDAEGIVLRDDKGNYKFTKEGLNTLNKAQRALVEQEVEVEEHLVTDLPEGLTSDEKEVFAGFVL